MHKEKVGGEMTLMIVSVTSKLKCQFTGQEREDWHIAFFECTKVLNLLSKITLNQF